jgi:hypothetical protein
MYVLAYLVVALLQGDGQRCESVLGGEGLAGPTCQQEPVQNQSISRPPITQSKKKLKA